METPHRAVILQPLCRVSSQGGGARTNAARTQSISVPKFTTLTTGIRASRYTCHRTRIHNARWWSIWICAITDLLDGVGHVDTGRWDEESAKRGEHRSEKQLVEHYYQRDRGEPDESTGGSEPVEPPWTAALEPRSAGSATVGHRTVLGLVVHLYLERTNSRYITNLQCGCYKSHL